MFRPNGSTELVGKQGHPLSCYNDTGCKSKLRILRCGSFHYPVLLQFLKNVLLALSDHQRIKDCSTKTHVSGKMPNTCFTYCGGKSGRELSAGIYNVMTNTRQQSTSVSTLLNQVACSDEQWEGNLCTMLQNVRGTKQYWFLRHSEFKCMIRDFGPPTLFLTFSCAEYESTDIATYLKRVNGIPEGTKCSIGTSHRRPTFSQYTVFLKVPLSLSMCTTQGRGAW